MLQEVIEQIKGARIPLVLYLDDYGIGDAGAKLVADALKEACAPITLHLSHNNIGVIGAEAIADSIRKALVPISLYLNNNKLGDEGIRLIADAMGDVRFHLILDLSFNNVGEAGAKLIAEAITRMETSLALDLGNNGIGDAGAISIAGAIRQAKNALVLYLHNNGIGDDGAVAIAGIIKEASSPFFLDLGLNIIGDNGAEQLASALIHAQAPITLDLYWNDIRAASVRYFAHALKYAKVPFCLCLDNSMGPDAERMLSDALQDNFIVDARLSPSRFLKCIGFNLCKKLLGQVFDCSFMASLIQDYVGSADLAWIEVSAIRAVDGASFENKYSSINSELLDTVYFNVSSSNQAEAPVFVEQFQPMKFNAMRNFNFERKRKRLVDYKWTPLKECKTNDEDEEEQYNDLDDAEDSESCSPQSSSSSPCFGYKSSEAQSEELASKQAREISLSTQAVNHVQQQVTQINNEGQDTDESQAFLEKLLLWIKDISEELQLHILSLFSIQQMLKFIESTLNPDKFITYQLSVNAMEEQLGLEDQLYANFTGASQAYAQSKLDAPIPLDDLFVDGGHIGSI
jgi:hypothetical protein